jgi:hypothetical protein
MIWGDPMGRANHDDGPCAFGGPCRLAVVSLHHALRRTGPVRASYASRSFPRCGNELTDPSLHAAVITGFRMRRSLPRRHLIPSTYRSRGTPMHGPPCSRNRTGSSRLLPRFETVRRWLRTPGRYSNWPKPRLSRRARHGSRESTARGLRGSAFVLEGFAGVGFCSLLLLTRPKNAQVADSGTG